MRRLSFHMKATPKNYKITPPQMYCLGTPFFPIACKISQMSKKGDSFTSIFPTTVNGFH